MKYSNILAFFAALSATAASSVAAQDEDRHLRKEVEEAILLTAEEVEAFAQEAKVFRVDVDGGGSGGGIPDTYYCHCKTRTGLGADPDHWLDGSNDLVFYSYLGDPTGQGDNWVWTVVDCGTFVDCDKCCRGYDSKK